MPNIREIAMFMFAGVVFTVCNYIDTSKTQYPKSSIYKRNETFSFLVLWQRSYLHEKCRFFQNLILLLNATLFI